MSKGVIERLAWLSDIGRKEAKGYNPKQITHSYENPIRGGFYDGASTVGRV
jgi:hypothetical protein